MCRHEFRILTMDNGFPAHYQAICLVFTQAGRWQTYRAGFWTYKQAWEWMHEQGYRPTWDCVPPEEFLKNGDTNRGVT